ncbi:MAG: 4-hydroxy-tetrahydrodipicolinate reductase [Candidatus Tokpelaia hoelldobleri]|uniref:4-hydroxy-tetrahydrodipicolinate reductase n=1 Tax=Candidatus Tokpelaia hoelldobleri TaxID=1902579 RepID=A0A1U9JV52_9HYPH|nr:MAG: 4-hydroxy-tetrahydrodipicolinate reductase [Candidatus Tokpelaia hoelldoblerii]
MRLAVVGAGGHMGRELTRIAAQTQGVKLVAALDHKDSEWLGHDAGVLAGLQPLGISVTDDPQTAFARVDAVLDFTRPEASIAYANYAAQAHIAHIIGTTGFSDSQEKKIAAAARKTAIVKSGNMSPGVNLLAGLVKKAAQVLSAEGFDIEIVEMHHRRKVDAPSGTALLLGEAAALGRGINLAEHSARGRDGHTSERETGAIGFASLRGGSVVGEHSVIFAGEGERITLSHSAENRTIFARGALKAALWAKGKPHGLYSMFDVLGLND